MAGNGVNDLNDLLKKSSEKGLDYGKEILMFENFIRWYDMHKYLKQQDKITQESDDKIKIIAKEIKEKSIYQDFKTNHFLRFFYKFMMKNIKITDKYFVVSDDCTSCERCKKICPVQNIAIQMEKPIFLGKCEQCMACIQTCPKEAINYKNKTQTRGRYFHPTITVDELIKLNR